jgi:hypothetical protein
MRVTSLPVWKARPAGFQYVAVASSATAAKASPMPAARAPGEIIRDSTAAWLTA